MASIGENIYSFITNSTAIAAAFTDAGGVVKADGAVQQNKIPQNPPLPRIWYARSGEIQDPDMSGPSDLVRSEWDIEVHSDDIGETLDIAAATKLAMNGIKGSFGGRDVLALFVEDHDDEYIPRGLAEDGGIHIAAIRAQIIFNTT